MFVISSAVSMHAENSSNKKKEEISGYEMEQVVVLSEKAKKALRKVKDTIEAPYQNRGYKLKELNIQYQQYNDAIEKLGRVITIEQTKSIQKQKELTLDQALVVMAYNVTNNPELLKELFEYYKRPEYEPGEPQPHVIRPKRLNRKHCKEKYRSCWEYLILAPQNEQVSFMNSRGGGHFSKALHRIHQIHTVPLLDYIFSVKINSQTFDRYFDSRILFMIGRFPTDASLSYLLEGLALCRDDKTGDFIKRSARTYYEILVIAMSGANNARAEIKVDRERWKEVILEYPKDDLPQWQKNFLDDVLKAIDEQEKIESERKTEKDK